MIDKIGVLASKETEAQLSNLDGACTEVLWLNHEPTHQRDLGAAASVAH